MNHPVRAWAALDAGHPLVPFEVDLGPLGADQVEVRVEHCGLCHSDLSMLDNDWGIAQFPLVPGHEIVGTVTAVGAHVGAIEVGQRVGVGWFAESCMVCAPCTGGDHHLCGRSSATIVGRSGGFAERVRCHWRWATPLPATLDGTSAGPLFCGGITVFSPFVEFDLRPTQTVGVVGIGGLGHLALKFGRAFGCEVVALTSNPAKADEALRLGAHQAISSVDDATLAHNVGRFDLILVTANVTLNWPAYLGMLKPRGRLHFVGAVLEPIPVPAFALIGGQKSISGSPLGAPATIATMLEFCARHQIAPDVEHFRMSAVNDALEHLRGGRARYRVVLDADFA